MGKNESDLKRWFCAQLTKNNLWYVASEPKFGVGTGAPDLRVRFSESVEVPFELKMAEYRKELLFPSEIRPAQISWHYRYAASGGSSYFCLGVDDKDTGGFRLWFHKYSDYKYLVKYKQGFNHNDGFWSSVEKLKGRIIDKEK